jgi:hypothetical protein
MLYFKNTEIFKARIIIFHISPEYKNINGRLTGTAGP